MDKQGLLEKIEQGINLTLKDEMEIFNLPPEDIKRLLLRYNNLTNYGLDDETEVKIFDLPAEIVKEIILQYIKKRHFLCATAEKRILDLPQEIAKEILITYIKSNPMTL